MNFLIEASELLIYRTPIEIIVFIEREKIKAIYGNPEFGQKVKT